MGRSRPKAGRVVRIATPVRCEPLDAGSQARVGAALDRDLEVEGEASRAIARLPGPTAVLSERALDRQVHAERASPKRTHRHRWRARAERWAPERTSPQWVRETRVMIAWGRSRTKTSSMPLVSPAPGFEHALASAASRTAQCMVGPLLLRSPASECVAICVDCDGSAEARTTSAEATPDRATIEFDARSTSRRASALAQVEPDDDRTPRRRDPAASAGLRRRRRSHAVRRARTSARSDFVARRSLATL